MDDSDEEETSSDEETKMAGLMGNEKKVKSGLIKSGKNNKITSLIKQQEDWPHTFLAVHFVTKEKEYEELWPSFVRAMLPYWRIVGALSYCIV